MTKRSPGTKMMNRGRRAPGRLSLAALLALTLGLPSAAVAQVEDKKGEAAVESFEVAPDEPRENLLDEAKKGPESDRAAYVQESGEVEGLERTEAAISQLAKLVQQTPRADVKRPEYMYRLADLYYKQSQFYEQRAFTRRDEANVIRSENPQRANAYEEAARDDLKKSEDASQKAIKLYADIYQEYRESYSGFDGVLYYLGVNLLQVGENPAAEAIFKELAQNYPSSGFLPQALLMLGELEFAAGEMDDALVYYDAVAQNPASSVYAYALYKKAWCMYNLSRSKDDFKRAFDQLYVAAEAAGAADSRGTKRLRRDALRDMTLFYIEAAPADKARPFFEKVAPDMAFDLLARLARLYGDKAMYKESNTLYRDLIRLNANSFAVADYQYEIVRNTRPSGDNVELVRELRRMVELFNLAKGFEDARPDQVQRTSDNIELLLRTLATTFHREAQTTHNEELYALAFSLYEDYAANFPQSEFSHTMWFYYGELLYRKAEWEKAAVAYQSAVDAGRAQAGGGQYRQESTYAACLAYTKTVDVSRATTVTSSDNAAKQGELPPIPTAQAIPDNYTRLIRSCDTYLATGPEADRAVEIEYVLAYLYYDYDNLDEAVKRFGEIAVNFAAVDPDRGRASAELLLDSLALQRRFLDMKRWIQVFREGPLNQGEFAGRLQLLSEQVDFKTCRDSQENKRHREAGMCFIEFVENHYESALVDKAFYNAALSFNEIDELDYALSAYQYLIELRPDSPLVPDTLYELGRTYHKVAVYDKAADYYEQYVDRAPKEEEEKIINALANASQFRAGLGQYDQAISTLRRFIRLTEGKKEAVRREGAAEATYQIALIAEERKQLDEAIKQYEAFIKKHGETLPSRAIEAHVRIADILLARGRRDRAFEWYERTLAFHARLDAESAAKLSNPGLDAAAKAQFMMGERVYEEFEKVGLGQKSEKAQQEALRKKLELGRSAATEYEKVFTFNRPRQAIAAFTRLGQLYHVFYLQIIDAPIPAEVEARGGLVAEEYRTALEEQAAQIKVEAADRYQRAIQISQQASYYSSYTDLAASELQRLDPSYRGGGEMRMEPGHDTVTWYPSGYVVSLIPDDEKKKPADAAGATPSPSDTAAPRIPSGVEGGAQ